MNRIFEYRANPNSFTWIDLSSIQAIVESYSGYTIYLKGNHIFCPKDEGEHLIKAWMDYIKQ